MKLNKISNRSRACLAAGGIFLAANSVTFAQWGDDAAPATVGVLTVAEQAVPVLNELPGRVAATRISEVRARVSGILLERVFEQGALVKEGDVLYRINPELFRVRVESAEAALQRAEATLANSRQQLKRQLTLRERNIASGVEYETAEVTVKQAEADVAASKAVLKEAKINLGYTEVRAPITGVIGGALITEGALVVADGTQNLALIQQIDPVYADFTQPAAELLKLKRAVEQGLLDSPAPGQISVQLVFDDGSVYGHEGRLLFSSAGVDATTGQVTLRGEFPNPKGDLLPGLYVRVRVEQAVRRNAIVVPQRAINRTMEGAAQVFVVGDGDTVEARDVKLGRVTSGNWIVEDGLKPGDRVIVDGVMKAQPGGKVTPEPLKVSDQQPTAAQK
ncbi:RND transporter [Ensifer adhaerens]|uniref:RND transporter n=1 Tax=Ensifer adhaerens TaxID=106592 RepID=A0A0L8BVC7_ENSAD|nr:RND transporter [Ensifer adhaerens]